MKKFTFDIQRFDDLATVSFGGVTASISSGVQITDESLVIGSDNDDTIISLNFMNNSDSVISVGAGSDSIEFVDDNRYWAGIGGPVTVNAGEEFDTINVIGQSEGIYVSKFSLDGEQGNDYINIVANSYGIVRSLGMIKGGDGDDVIRIIVDSTNGVGINNSTLSIAGGADDDLISIYGGTYGIAESTVLIDGGEGSDIIAINAILGGNTTIIAGNGDNISIGSGFATYLFDSTDAVIINGITFKASEAGSNASIGSWASYDYTDTSIRSAWTGTVELNGTNSLADIDGSIVSAAGSYQIVDGKLASSSDILPIDSIAPVDTVTPATITPTDTVTPISPTETITPTDTLISPTDTVAAQPDTVAPIFPTDANGQVYDFVFIVDTSGSMGRYIADVRNNIRSFATSLSNSGISARFGLVSYETDASAKTFDGSYLTSDVDSLTAALNSLSVDGGTEYGLTAIESALSIVSDEDATTKRFITITDEDFDDDHILNAGEVISQLNSRGITMDVIGVEGSCRTEWEPQANDTGGKFYLLGAGFSTILESIVTELVNVVDLNRVPDSQTGYFVAFNSTDTITTPTFQLSGWTTNDTTVGAVESVNVYVADNDTDRPQTIIIPSGWNVTATKNDDILRINGVSATVTGGEGQDLFALGTDTRTIALMDIDPAEDKLSFGNYITPGTLNQTLEDGHLVLSADNLRVDLPAMAAMTEEFLEYSVSNAGNSNTIRELLYGTQNATSYISFAHWTFSFDSTSGGFSFF